MPQPQDTDAPRCRAILLYGARIRALSAAAPFFGPRADEATQARVWATLDAERAALARELDALSAARPELRPMLMLESEGCGEMTYNGLAALSGRPPEEVGLPPFSAEEEAVIDREVGVLLSRLAAVRGEADPEHGIR